MKCFARASISLNIKKSVSLNSYKKFLLVYAPTLVFICLYLFFKKTTKTDPLGGFKNVFYSIASEASITMFAFE